MAQKSKLPTETENKVSADLCLFQTHDLTMQEAIPVFDGMLIISIGVVLFVIIEIEAHLRLRIQAMRSSGGRRDAHGKTAC